MGSLKEMDISEYGFLATEKASCFIEETAAVDKRSHMVTRIDKSRFCVACVGEKCQFKVRFWRWRDGKFTSHATSLTVPPPSKQP